MQQDRNLYATRTKWKLSQHKYSQEKIVSFLYLEKWFFCVNVNMQWPTTYWSPSSIYSTWNVTNFHEFSITAKQCIHPSKVFLDGREKLIKSRCSLHKRVARELKKEIPQSNYKVKLILIIIHFMFYGAVTCCSI